MVDLEVICAEKTLKYCRRQSCVLHNRPGAITVLPTSTLPSASCTLDHSLPIRASTCASKLVRASNVVGHADERAIVTTERGVVGVKTTLLEWPVTCTMVAKTPSCVLFSSAGLRTVVMRNSSGMVSS